MRSAPGESGLPVIVLAVLALVVWCVGRQTAAAQSTSNRTLSASNTTSPISIDARLDEEAWQSAEIATDFAQFEPTEGAPGSQRTEVRVLYDEAYLYVGAIHHDDQPARIEDALSNLQSNVVLRWEYRPGSALYLVWTHARSAERVQNRLAPWNASPYERPFDTQIADAFHVFPENVFLIKLNYTFLY